MLSDLDDTEQRTDVRPVGAVQSAREEALRALKALDDHRPGDADKHLATLPDSQPGDRAWKFLISGLVAVERVRFAEAEAFLLQAWAGWEARAAAIPIC